MLIYSFIFGFILGCIIDSLLSKHFYDKIRQAERTGYEAVAKVRLEEEANRLTALQHVHEDKLGYIQAMYQENVAKLRSRYGG